MIVSVSRRTDIPAFYADWFFRRLKEGFVLVRNPMNVHQVSRVRLDAEAVDGFVFWTKNPAPMLDKLPLLQGRAYYFQFTLTAYGRDVETHLPSKGRVLVPTFRRLAEIIGPERVLWRYDPILLNDVYTPEVHLRRFEALAKRLAPYTRRCTISFFAPYRVALRNTLNLGLWPIDTERKIFLAKRLAEIAKGYGLEMVACAEETDLFPYGVKPASCVDGELFAKLLGCPLHAEKDKNQRPLCGCVESIDIGAYHTCRNGCRYCYATSSEAAAKENARFHDPASPLLIGELGEKDAIHEREMRSLCERQTRLSL